MKIIVTQFYTNNVPYAKYSTVINKKYCEDNSYEYYEESNTKKILSSLEGRSITWYKPHLLKTVFEKYPDADYYLLLDIDAVVTDFTKKIEDFITDDFNIMMTDDYGPSLVNAGVMFVKNNDFSKKFIQDWWDICEEFPEYKTGLWHDQTCLGLLYKRLEDKSNFKIVSHDLLNSSLYKRGEFIFHAFSFGNLRNRMIDRVYYDLFNIEPEVDENSLMNLGDVFPTDKHYLHNYYSQVYQDVLSPLKKDIKTVLEIGTLDGNSLKIFNRFFKDAKVYGADINPQQISDKDVVVYKCDQSKKEDLNDLSDKFESLDFIIDDGSHKMLDQQITLAVLFKKLTSNGIYILEDLHTSTECLMPEKAMFGWGDPTKTITLKMLEEFNLTGNLKSDYLTEEEEQYLSENILSCEIYTLNNGGSITSIIKKK